MSSSLLVILALFAQVAEMPTYRLGNQERVDANGDPVFNGASITAEEDSIISAEAEGTLVKLAVKEGDRVGEKGVLATIDERLAQAQVEAAELTLDAATERAKDKVEEQYAVLAADVAEVDWKKDQAANASIPNSVTDIQILQKKLVFDRSNLQIEKAQKDQVIAKKEAAVKGAELTVAKIGLDRRIIKAPFEGEVQQLFQKESQWVNPGDPLLRLVKFDVLRVESRVRADKFDPSELAGKPVTVSVRLARDRQVTLPGRVTYVSQTVNPVNQEYLVRAEIQNKREGDYWLVRPGLFAEMTIHVSQPAQPQARGIAAPTK
jgi:multidrug efflux pump subunit AcrA (membrane-fusion protein)